MSADILNQLLNVNSKLLEFTNSCLQVIQVILIATGFITLSFILDDTISRYGRIFFLKFSILMFLFSGVVFWGNEIITKNFNNKIKNNIEYTYEEMFIPYNVSTLDISDYTKEIVSNGDVYNIKCSEEVKILKMKSKDSGLIVYKFNIKSKSPSMNEAVLRFKENPIYILKEIRYW